MNLLLITFFAISLTINIVFVWYVRELLKQFSVIESQFGKMFEDTLSYEEHLESVYNMDTFFGEPVLSSLLEHTKQVKKDLKSVRDSFKLYEDEK